MVENIKQSEFNKNVIQVYTQEANFTGYKGFDFTAIDDLEYLIRAELIPYASGIKSSIDQGVNTNQLDLNYITDNVSISGRALTYLSGIANAGVNVNQSDLNYITDNVSISGQALSYLSGIAEQGVSLKGLNTVNVNVTGGSLNVLNEVEITNALNNPVPVSFGTDPLPISGTVTANVPFASTTATFPSQLVALGFQDVLGTGNIVPVTNDSEAGLPVFVKNISVEGNPNTLFPAWLDGNAPRNVPITGTVTANVDGMFESESLGRKAIYAIPAFYNNQALETYEVSTNTPLPISGTVTANGGDFVGEMQAALPPKFVAVAGRDINANELRPIPVAVSADTGLDYVPIAGTVSVEPVRTSGISNYTINTNVGQAIAQNPDRKELCLQNLSNNILYVKYGSAASSSSFNFILSANSVVDAGDGGILTDQNYNGLVSVSGVSPRFIAWERT